MNQWRYRASGFGARWGGLAAGLVLGLLAGTAGARAEDADRFRPYFFWRSYEFDATWDVHDAHGVSFGANLDGHWGVELSLDVFQRDLYDGRGLRVAEMTTSCLAPAVRYRWPLLNDRLVPYAVAGVGAAFLQDNDRKSPGYGVELEAGGVEATANAGLGIEYFIDDQVAFGVEGKYAWVGGHDTLSAGVPGSADMSSYLMSLGLRMYFDENHVREFADVAGRPAPNRLYFGVRAGMSATLDNVWGNGITLTPLQGSLGDVANKHFGVMAGLNLSPQLALELAVDGGETVVTVDDKFDIGEYAQVAIIPQLRYRWPLHRGRVVPYVMAGAGPLFAEFNDAKSASPAFEKITARGFYKVARGGLGLEYFLSRNLSFSLETNYQQSWGHEIQIAGRPKTVGGFSSIQTLLMFRVYLFEFGGMGNHGT